MNKLKTNRLLIVGAGGHGAVVADTAQLMNRWSNIYFLDAKWPEKENLYGWKIIGNDKITVSNSSENDEFFVAIGASKKRMSFINKIKKLGKKLATVIHPSAVVSEHVNINVGTLIAAGAVVNIGTQIETGCIINTGAIIDHECRIGDGTHICPNVSLAGNVNIGKNSWVGIGSTIIQGITVGSNSCIGAGALVISNIPDNVIAFGIPTKIYTEEN